MIQTLFGSTEEKKAGLFERMKQAVTRTRENLAERIDEVVSFGKEIDGRTLDDLEATLIGADLGNTTTQEVLGKLRDRADRKQIKDVQELKRLLKEEVDALLFAKAMDIINPRWLHQAGAVAAFSTHNHPADPD